jgi:methyltransferase (TIGR00027 family)
MRPNCVSRTAVKIGNGLVFIAHDPRMALVLPKGTAETSERLMTLTGLLKPRELSLYHKRWFRNFASFTERHTLPGGSLSIAVRKRFFDDEVRAAIEAGATQVLVVGAGFDTLAIRLSSEHPEVSFVEIDHPPTHEAKRRGVEALEACRPNLHLLGVDLASASLEDALASLDGWESNATTVVLAEGVLMYLEESAVSSFLDSVHRSTGKGSRLLFTTLSRDDKNRVSAGKLSLLMRLSLQLMGEPWLWGIREQDLENFLEGHGYRLERRPEDEELRRRFLVPAGLGKEPLGDVERLAIAVTSSSGDG